MVARQRKLLAIEVKASGAPTPAMPPIWSRSSRNTAQQSAAALGLHGGEDLLAPGEDSRSSLVAGDVTPRPIAPAAGWLGILLWIRGR